jgi:anti-sigma B factor antagonist
MKFSTGEVYNAKVINIKGKLRGGPEAEEFHSTLQSFINESKKNIIIDMSDVSFVDSAGLGILVRGYTTIKNAGGEMKLAGISNKVKGVLAITKLNSVFEQFTSVEEASNNF